MTFRSLLIPLRGEHANPHSVTIAQQVADRLGAALNVFLIPDSRSMTRLPHAVEQHESDLVILLAGEFFGSQAQAVIHHSPVPVLLMPETVEIAPPWHSILVPMSGEARASSAFEKALQLAITLDLPVDVVHVANPGTVCCKATSSCMLKDFSDEPQHEVPSLMEEFLSRASPNASLEERRHVRHFAVKQGDTCAELMPELLHGTKLVAVEWHGTLRHGRAQLLRRLIRNGNLSLLLVKQKAQARSRLRVGRNMAA